MKKKNVLKVKSSLMALSWKPTPIIPFWGVSTGWLWYGSSIVISAQMNVISASSLCCVCKKTPPSHPNLVVAVAVWNMLNRHLWYITLSGSPRQILNFQRVATDLASWKVKKWLFFYKWKAEKIIPFWGYLVYLWLLWRGVASEQQQWQI